MFTPHKTTEYSKMEVENVEKKKEVWHYLQYHCA